MASIDKMIDFALSKHHKVGYSMDYPERLGPRYYDCSSFVYYALIAGGFLKENTLIGNTESLYRLNKVIFKEIYDYDFIKRGDIFIRGLEGYSAGANGHTGIFLDKDKIIHCNYPNRGVSINDKYSYISYYLDRKRSDHERYFRPIIEKNDCFFVETIARAFVKMATNVRARPSVNSQIVAIYPPGSFIYYDRVIENEGYTWISYIATKSRLRRYVACCDERSSWIDLEK